MKIKKAYLLAAFFATIAAVGLVHGYNTYQATKFNDIEVDDVKLNGNDILDSNEVTRITVGASNTIIGNVAITGNQTVTGNLTPSGTSYFTIVGSSAPRDASSTIGIIPTAIAQLVFNTTDRELCLSTATNRFSWVMISSVSTAGANVVAPCRH